MDDEFDLKCPSCGKGIATGDFNLLCVEVTCPYCATVSTMNYDEMYIEEDFDVYGWFYLEIEHA